MASIITWGPSIQYIDPSGLFVWDAALGGSDTDEELLKRLRRNEADDIIRRRREIRNALTTARNAANALGGGADRDNVLGALAAFGTEGSPNGVVISSGAVRDGFGGSVTPNADQPLSFDPATGQFTANVTVTFRAGLTGNDLAITAAHEGSHVRDRQAFALAAGRDPNALRGNANLTQYQTEFGAFVISSLVAQGIGFQNYNFGGHEVWNAGWAAADRERLRSNGINNYLASPAYGLTPQMPGANLYPR